MVRRTTRTLLALLFASIFVFGFGARASAENYYVSVNGDAAWPVCSTFESPCSWQTALGNAIAGDTVYFREGTYDPGAGPGFSVPAMNPAHSGNSESPIVFKAYPGEDVTILEASGGGISGTEPSIGGYNRDWIVWDGFRLTRNLDTGYGASSIVSFDMCDNCVVRNCDISGVTPHMDHTNGVLIAVLNSENVEIYNNRLHGMVGDDNPDEDTVNTGAMWIFNFDHIYIYNNDIYDVNNGVQTKVNTSFLYVYKNHFWNCSGAALNIVPQNPTVTDYIFYQNVIRNCGVALYSPDPGSTIYNMRFYNNTVYNTGSGSLALLGNPSYHNFRATEVYNNIIHNAGSGNTVFIRYFNGEALPVFADRNVFFGPGYWNLNYVNDYYSLEDWVSASGLDSHSLLSDPIFVNAGGTNPNGYKLQAGSSSRTAGIDRQDHDSDGDLTEVIPAGAFIEGNEIIGFSTGGEEEDTTVPNLSSHSPTGTLTSGTTQATLSLITNESAICRYSIAINTAYDDMANIFINTGGTTHSTIISGLTDGSNYNYYVRCMDGAGNANADDYQISFSVATSATYNLQDFIALQQVWLTPGDQSTDINQDNVVNARDLGIMMSSWED